MTTEELIAEIERLDAAATAGPWHGYNIIRRDEQGRPNVPAYIEILLSDEDSETIIEVWSKDEDAELIASYRTLAVEAARRLRQVVKAVADREFMRGFYDAMDAADAGDTGKTLVEIREEHGLES